ncbi:MAG TPA: hypothetical protein VHG69_07415 [Thermoleophilaceae bacterium]|nr:hypothetical protein [Thermoleophilaceae bacterium]
MRSIPPRKGTVVVVLTIRPRRLLVQALTAGVAMAAIVLIVLWP